MKIEDGWYEGLYNGKRGVFPSNYVEKINADNQLNTSTNNLSNESINNNSISENIEESKLNEYFEIALNMSIFRTKRR